MLTIVDQGSVVAVRANEDGAKGLKHRTMLAAAPERRLSCNLVAVEPGGVTKQHRHVWEQVNYIVSGKGTLLADNGFTAHIYCGMIIHVPTNELHWFKNTGEDDLVILGVLGPDAK